MIVRYVKEKNGKWTHLVIGGDVSFCRVEQLTEWQMFSRLCLMPMLGYEVIAYSAEDDPTLEIGCYEIRLAESA